MHQKRRTFLPIYKISVSKNHAFLIFFPLCSFPNVLIHIRWPVNILWPTVPLTIEAGPCCCNGWWSTRVRVKHFFLVRWKGTAPLHQFSCLLCCVSKAAFRGCILFQLNFGTRYFLGSLFECSWGQRGLPNYPKLLWQRWSPNRVNRGLFPFLFK